MSDVLIHTADGITTITFNRPERKNALTQDMYALSANALEAAASDPKIRVVVIQGSDTLFTAGSDVGRFADSQAGEMPKPTESQSFRFLSAIASFNKPLVAVVCGLAIGIGTTMLLHCDYVVAGDNAYFSAPFVGMGLCPEGGSSLLAPQLMGYRKAVELLMLAAPLNANAARDMDLVNRVVPSADARAIGRAVALQFAAKPLTSLIAAKRLLKGDQTPAVISRIVEEGETFWQMMGEPAAREAIAALQEKRKPDFSKF